MSDDYKPVLRAGSDPLVFFKYPGAEGGSVAKGHIMAAAIAHALRDGELVFMGANSLIPLAGARLAQLTHAPNLTTLVGASGGVNTLVEPLAPSSGDYANLVAEAVLDFQDVLAALMAGRGDVFFAGGLQIDRRGNCNLVRIGPASSPTLRGPGSAAIPWAQRCKRTILYTTSHTPRVFVPKVDFVSLPGYPTRRAKTSPYAGPDLVITPLAVLDFTASGDMRLKSLHPGVTLEHVQQNTGFDLALPPGDIPLTTEPTPEELRLMRDFDSDGLLTIVV
ncbi:MAG: CoA-transferase subunit beta [Chloroflexia bacterium]